MGELVELRSLALGSTAQRSGGLHFGGLHSGAPAPGPEAPLASAQGASAPGTSAPGVEGLDSGVCDPAAGARLDWQRERALGWDAQRRLWWWLWSRCPGLGWVRLNRLWAQLSDPALAWAASTQQICAWAQLSPGQGEALEAYRAYWGDDPLALASLALAREGPLLVPGDRSFPQALLALARPPLCLRWRGRGGLWAPLRARQAIAVVGTRRPSPHGLAMAEAIGAALAQAGWPVVSGLAEGIDGAAHWGCLARGGRPVAVLGTPIERVYPRHHEELQRQVGQRGLLLSEWPAGGAVQPGHFAARNRLQVALARAVVVVECPESSGALHSARLAWDQGLPIWVVPADAGKRSAMGSNRLLTGMASALIDPRDLIRQLGPGPLATATPLATAVPQATAIPLTAAAEAGFGNAAGDPELLAAVGSGATMEQLSLELDQSAAALASRLLALELSGSLRAMPGLRWQPT